jgi:hypothetical protein
MLDFGCIRSHTVKQAKVCLPCEEIQCAFLLGPMCAVHALAIPIGFGAVTSRGTTRMALWAQLSQLPPKSSASPINKPVWCLFLQRPPRCCSADSDQVVLAPAQTAL